MLIIIDIFLLVLLVTSGAVGITLLQKSNHRKKAVLDVFTDRRNGVSCLLLSLLLLFMGIYINL